jgi:hypothetical protein
VPDLPGLEWDRIPLGPFDSRLWWLLIGLCLALLLTLQAIETAVEGAWPHQRRSTRFAHRARWMQRSWGLIALFVVAGALLAIGIVAVHLWQAPPSPDEQTLGAILLGTGWILFLLFSLNAIGLGRLMGNLGVLGPIAILAMLVVGDILLLTAFLDVVPDWPVVRDGIEDGLRDILPFVE